MRKVNNVIFAYFLVLLFVSFNNVCEAKIIHNKRYMTSSDYFEFNSNLNADNNRRVFDRIKYNTNVGNIINYINTDGNVNVYNKVGNVISDNSILVGTGYKVKIVLSSNTYEYLISVRGDATGDGLINVSDIVDVANTIVKNRNLDYIYKSASDYNNDGLINVSDIVGIARVIVNDNYSDNINDYRCYTDGNTRILYNVTECEPAIKENAKCKYKETSSSEMVPFLRKKLGSITNCDGNIVGATGYSVSNNKYLKQEPNNSSSNITSLEAGKAFRILSSSNNDTWWKVSYNNKIGYVENAYMMINLPDYIPSMKFNMMHAKPNIYTASGVKLSIYGEQLYSVSKIYNYRLERNEYIVPVVYEFAKKILIAQKNANAEGYGLLIYDAYRPKSVADRVRDSLSDLYYSNSTVRNGIDYSYENGTRVEWGQSWFIAQGISAHSYGAAIDVVLFDLETGKEIAAQSSIHDLSTDSVKYNTPISGQTVVRNDLYSEKATKHTKDLDRIMLSSGMTNLASEWWHFQDNDTRNKIRNLESDGLNFQLWSIDSVKK